MSLWLSQSELIELTGKRQHPKQIEVMTQMTPPVKFRVRPDGFPLVDRAQFQGAMPQRRKEPNFAAMG